MKQHLRRVGVLLVGSSFLGYWALLVYCDVWRPSPFGMHLNTNGGRVVIVDVASGGPAARAGLRAGDRIASVDGSPMTGRLDWMAVEANLVFGRAIELSVDRAGTLVGANLTPETGSWQVWRSQQGPTLAAVRAMQLVTLLLAWLVAFKRSSDATALVGGAFLATIGVFSLVLPLRFASVWRVLPLAAQALLIVPFMSSVAIAAWGFSFFALFLRVPLRAPLLWMAIWLPMVPGLVGHATYGYHVIGFGRPASPAFPWVESLLIVGVVHVICVLVLIAWAYGRLTDVNEQRRVRVLAFGSLIGIMGGTPVALWFWRSATGTVGEAIFTSPFAAFGTFLFLGLPLSFAYAILRHRLFDISVIIRQGLRYALARRALLALVPALVALAAVDVLAQGDESLASVLRSRAWVYAMVAGVAVLARSRRQIWLDALDRNFFRERYNAQQVLRQVAANVRQAQGLASMAPTIVSRIEQALHPTFAALLVRDGDGRCYRVAAASPAADATSVKLDAQNKVLALVRLVGKPLETSGSDTEWLARKLPIEDIRAVQVAGIGLIVPVTSSSGDVPALFVLGPKRSDEPYAADDGELLMAIAESVALRLPTGDSVAAPADRFQECPTCGRCYGLESVHCEDGTQLAAVSAPRLLANRYWLERRLGRGGMGTVYAASDTLLERPVAAKLMREDLVGLPGAAERFQREARAAAAFSHPNIVTVYDFGVTGTCAFLVMEQLEGRTLRDLLRAERRIDCRRALVILKHVTSAVEAAHQRPIVHRDLKPENIYLVSRTSGEIVKVLDFGLAKVVAPAGAGPLTSHATGGAVLGTPLYMSPEQLRGEDPDPSWDLWALAIVTFEMLTGSHPFMAAPLGLDPSPREWAGDPRLVELPRGCGPFFARALAIDRSLRPTSAAVFFDELERNLHA